jgi:hypothetical protein
MQWAFGLQSTFEEDRQQLGLGAKVPYAVQNHDALFRAFVPYRWAQGCIPDHGAGTFQLDSEAIFTPSWGSWGVGPAVLWTPNGVGFHGAADRIQVGAAAFATARFAVLSVGLFARTVAGPTSLQTILQPVVGIAPVEWLTVSLGNPEQVFDWRRLRFAALPVGLEVSALLRPYGQHVRLSANPEVDVANRDVRWSANFGVEVLMP